jgi:hypothetical protein
MATICLSLLCDVLSCLEFDIKVTACVATLNTSFALQCYVVLL